MKIVSYNVNGIRAALKKGFMEWLIATDPDVLCLQETKAHKDQLDLSLFEEAGYPFHYWFSAQKKVIALLQFYVRKNLTTLLMERVSTIWTKKVETLG